MNKLTKCNKIKNKIYVQNPESLAAVRELLFNYSELYLSSYTFYRKKCEIRIRGEPSNLHYVD